MISREEAREILKDMHDYMHSGYITHLAHGGKQDRTIEDDIEALFVAISALSQPERQEGRWDPISADRVRCTNCDAIRDITTQLFWDSCPNCGADMREVEG